MPTSLALLLAGTPPQKRGSVVRAWSAVGGVAAALGPVVGGLLVEASWRWVFLVNVPVGIVAFILGLRALPEVRNPEKGKLPDLLGAAMLTVSIAALSLGLVEANDWGWGSGRVIGCFVGAFVLLVAFIYSSARHPSPIVELSMLRIRAFSTPTLAIALFTAAFAGMILSSTLWAQNIWGYSALKTGLAIAPGPLMVPPLAIGAGPLAKRIGVGPIAALGNLSFAGGIVWWAVGITVHANYATALLPGTILVGIGVGLALPTLTAASATALPPQRFATGSGIMNMGRQVGAVLGVAILVSVLGKPHGADAAHTAFRHGWYVTIVISVLAAIVSLFVRKPTAMPTQVAPVGQQAQAPVAP
jgi:MFS family permease